MVILLDYDVTCPKILKRLINLLSIRNPLFDNPAHSGSRQQFVGLRVTPKRVFVATMCLTRIRYDPSFGPGFLCRELLI